MSLEDILFAIIIILMFVILWLMLVVMTPDIEEVEIISIRSYQIEYDKEKLLEDIELRICERIAERDDIDGLTIWGYDEEYIVEVKITKRSQVRLDDLGGDYVR